MYFQSATVFFILAILANAETKIPEYPFASVILTGPNNNATLHETDFLLKCDFNITYPKNNPNGVNSNWDHEVGFWHSGSSAPENFYQVGVYKKNSPYAFAFVNEKLVPEFNIYPGTETRNSQSFGNSYKAVVIPSDKMATVGSWRCSVSIQQAYNGAKVRYFSKRIFD